MKSVEDLEVFQLAHTLTLKVYEVTATFPREEMFGLVSQTRRAASSIGMNLAEGAMRLSRREYRHHVGIARGSAAEVSYQLLLAKDLQYLRAEQYKELRVAYERVGQMLTRLGQSLDREPASRTP
ncbi:MAG: four helix bundle protein [Candidatus Binatia bacterium]